MNQFRPVPILETDRLILREHSLDDFQHSAAMWAAPQVVAHISGEPLTNEQAWARFLRYTGHWCHLGFGYWVVESRSDSEFLGEVGFADYRRNTTPCIKGIPEAGWVLKPEAHGNGFATEAVSRMLRWADQELKVEKTVCIMDPSHAMSLNVAKKNGYGNQQMGHYGENETLFMERPRVMR